MPFGDAVAVAADGSAQERLRAVDDMLNGIVALHHIGIFAFFIGYHNGENCTTVVGDSHLHT